MYHNGGWVGEKKSLPPRVAVRLDSLEDGGVARLTRFTLRVSVALGRQQVSRPKDVDVSYGLSSNQNRFQ